MDRQQTFAVDYSAGSVQPVINGLPKRGRLGPYYLKRIDFRLAFSLTSAASALAVQGRRIIEAISTIDLRPKEGLPLLNSLHAQTMRMMQWSVWGKQPVDPADIPVNANVTTTGEVTWSMPFYDTRKKQPKDGGLPLTFVSQGALNVNFQGAGYFGTGVTIDDATTLYITFVYEERFDTDIGERITYEEVAVTGWDSQPVPPGMLTDLLLMPLDGSSARALNENSFSALSFDEDGDRILVQVQPDDVIHAYNRSMIFDNLSAVPTLDATQTEFIPLIWPQDRNYDYGDVAIADSQFQLQASIGSGSPATNNYRLATRRVLAQNVTDQAAQVSSASPDVDQGEAQLGLQAANKLGPDAAHGIVRPTTNSKVPLGAAGSKGAVYGRFMPRKVNPTALRGAARAVAANAAK